MVSTSRKGKYAQKGSEKFKTGTWVWVGGVVLAAVVLIAVFVASNNSVYREIVRQGYTGTQERWLASLVGEETDSNVESAYELAVKNGYQGSETEWIEALTGICPESVKTSPYKLACENGFEGTLSDWLTQIADEPEKLGVSNGKGQKTEYELACEYGYSGTFIEWLVSVTQDKVF